MTPNVNADFPPAFREMLEKSSPSQKRAMIIALQNSLKEDYINQSKSNIDFSEYIEVVNDFLPPNYFDEGITAEVESLGLFNKKSSKPQTQWLSNDNRAYCFSDNSRNSHPSKDILQYPNICKLMEMVNGVESTTQNADAALIIVYNKDQAGIDFHDDGESLIDGSSSISTVTFGSARDVQFCDHTLYPRLPQHSVNCGNHNLMIMKPGCQQRLVHRVCQGKTNGEEDERRFVISFRKLSPPDSSPDTDPEISFGVSSPAAKQQKSSPSPRSTPRVTLIFGDSHTIGLDESKLGRKGRKRVVNMSQPGAHIGDVRKQIESFYLSEEHASGNVIVEKVFVSVGTNDIRDCRENGTRVLKAPLLYLAEQLKLLYPEAVVWFQNLVPLPWQHKFTFRNVQEFNKIIYEVCKHTQMYFLDIFNDFLVFNPRYNSLRRRESLFVDSKNIHLNKFGLSRLARRYINLIHNSFNPLGF